MIRATEMQDVKEKQKGLKFDYQHKFKSALLKQWCL